MKFFMLASIRMPGVLHVVQRVGSRFITLIRLRIPSVEILTAVLGVYRCYSGEIYLQLLEEVLHQNTTQTE